MLVASLKFRSLTRQLSHLLKKYLPKRHSLKGTFQPDRRLRMLEVSFVVQ